MKVALLHGAEKPPLLPASAFPHLALKVSKVVLDCLANPKWPLRFCDELPCFYTFWFYLVSYLFLIFHISLQT